MRATKTRTPAEPTAAQAYKSAAKEIERRIAALQGCLKTHAKEQAAEPMSWGYHGDLGYVRGLLDQAIAFLNNDDDF